MSKGSCSHPWSIPVTRVSILLLATVAVVLPLLAQAPANGELVVHYNDELGVGFTFPYLAILNPSGSARSMTNVPPEGDILLAPNGNLFVASSEQPGIAIFSGTFVLSGTMTTSAPTRFLAMDAGGFLYAGTPAGDVHRYDPAGSLVDTYHVALDSGDEIAAGDLGRDQCTLYYLAADSNPRVRRYDVCQRQQLADLGTVSVCTTTRASLRVANDDAVLVAGCVAAYRFSTQGTQTYPLASIAIAPTMDAQFFWTGESTLSLINAVTGAVVSGPIAPPATGPVTSIEIAGAPRASLAVAAPVPAVSPLLLVLLTTALALVGIQALRSC
jgi:hypothetical protein